MAGAYAVQAMESDGAWSAATSLQVIAASRVCEWRQKHRVQRDADFAFYFTSYEQAVRHHVADAWTVARAEQEGCLMSAASAAVEGQRRQIGRRCPGPLRLREGGKAAWRLPSPMVVSCESAGRSWWRYCCRWALFARRAPSPMLSAGSGRGLSRGRRHVSWTERTGPQAHACHCLRPWSGGRSPNHRGCHEAGDNLRQALQKRVPQPTASSRSEVGHASFSRSALDVDWLCLRSGMSWAATWTLELAVAR